MQITSWLTPSPRPRIRRAGHYPWSMATIRIEDFDERPKAKLVLSNGTTLSLRRPSLRPSLESSWAACRPGWGGARAAADRLLAASFASSGEELPITALSERDRRRLTLAVVGLLGAESRWRGLYGTSLTVDERLFAIVVDARRREGAELRGRLRETRRGLRQRLQPRRRLESQRVLLGSTRSTVASPG